MLRLLYFLITIYVVRSYDQKSKESKAMIGLDTVHVNVNKDTIINSNMILNNKQHLKSTNEESTDPDIYSSFPDEVKNHVLEFKRNMSDCLKEVQKNDHRPVKRLSPNKESPVHGECLIACVLKRNGIIHNGKVHKENLLNLVMKFYAKDVKLIKKLEKNLDRCIESSVRSKDDCTIAARLNECTNDLMENNKHKITVNY